MARQEHKQGDTAGSLPLPLPIQCAHVSEQGVRPTMEDEVSLHDSFFIPGRGYFSFFAVFDGHGGRAAASFARDRLCQLVRRELESGVEPARALAHAYIKTDNLFIAACKGDEQALAVAQAAIPSPNTQQQQQQNANDSQLSNSSAGHRRQNSANLAVKIPNAESGNAQAAGSAATNTSCSSCVNSSSSTTLDPSLRSDTSGTTAISVLLHHDTYTLYTANAGDSRAVLSSRSGRVVPLSKDQKADRPDEQARIRKAGGFVVHKRVMGELAISRAIGDLDFKDIGFAFVLPHPELCTRQLGLTDDFVLLACDGLFDVLSNEQACAFVRDRLKEGMRVEDACQKIVHHAIDKLNTRDNVSVVVVKLPTEDDLRKAALTRNIDSVTTGGDTPELRDSAATGFSPGTPRTSPSDANTAVFDLTPSHSTPSTTHPSKLTSAAKPPSGSSSPQASNPSSAAASSSPSSSSHASTTPPRERSSPRRTSSSSDMSEHKGEPFAEGKVSSLGKSEQKTPVSGDATSHPQHSQ